MCCNACLVLVVGFPDYCGLMFCGWFDLIVYLILCIGINSTLDIFCFHKLIKSFHSRNSSIKFYLFHLNSV